MVFLLFRLVYRFKAQQFKALRFKAQKFSVDILSFRCYTRNSNFFEGELIMKKKIIALLSAAAMTVALTACGGSGSSDSGSATSAASGEKYLVGICQLVQHDALDAATQGFKDALVEALGDQVEFDEQNASGEAANCSTIINGFLSKDVDLIMANATPALTAAASATSEVPILGTSVTAYSAALDLDDATFNGPVGGNISGTSDLPPLDQQAKMIVDWVPEAKTAGIIYCTAEANSAYQVKVITEELGKLGVQVKEYSFTDSNDIASVTTKAASEVDVIYLPTDNTVASNTEAIANIVIPAKVPVIAGEVGIMKACGIASLSISYYDLGYTTGNMAARILKGEANISEMPIEYTEVTAVYNPDLCDQYGITPLEGYTVAE